MTRSGMISGAQHHLARKMIIIGPLIYFSVISVLKHDNLVWQIATFDPDPRLKGKMESENL